MKRVFGISITEPFRRSMHSLHTWAGVALGGLLFAIFWMGSLSVFDAEIDQWMKPELRTTPISQTISIDAYTTQVLSDTERSPVVTIDPPTSRKPILVIGYRNAEGPQERRIDPSTGEALEETDSLAGTGFFYPFHYGLHINWMGLGVWIVGFATMGMLALIVSGIFIHRKIVKDFFTFRPKRALRRSTLDMHNVSALVALPFNLFLPLTGLIIFVGIYFPWSIAVPFQGNQAALNDEVFGFRFPAAASEPMSPLASIDGMIVHAESTWSDATGQAEKADQIRIFQYGDANAIVQVRQLFPTRRVAINRFAMTFGAETGDVIDEHMTTPIVAAQGWATGLHFIQFDHWPLRWLYFLGGLLGCVMIATGNLFWMRARIREKEADAIKVRTVRALTIGAVTGIIAASGAFLIANRLLPREAAFLGFERAALEMWAFVLVWIGAILHAAIRDKAAWRDQCWMIASIGVVTVFLNWITTGDHLFVTAGRGLWSVAGMDLVLLAIAAIAAWAVYRLRKTERLEATSQARVVRTNPEAAE